MRTRDTNLDLLRAVAILMVVAVHIGQRWPGASAMVRALAEYGLYGVDLFFVLSGWLIGGLLWREQAQFGGVELGRFVCRRALRTIPPYFAALAITYLGVFVARGEKFDWGYLVFLQNYYDRLPYFHPSWSLCIEEHFYLAMFLLALTLTRFRAFSRSHLWLLWLAGVPPLCRAIYSCHWPMDASFGYHLTATHVRYEGLLLGVWAAFLRQNRPRGWELFRRIASVGMLPAMLGVAAADFLPGRLRYAVFYTALAVFFLILLVSVVERPAICFSDSRVVFWIASVSYSVYLTHLFTLDIVWRLIARMPGIAALQMIVTILCIGASGTIFYRCVEVPSLALRHRLMPGRTRERSLLLDAVSATPEAPAPAKGPF